MVATLVAIRVSTIDSRITLNRCVRPVLGLLLCACMVAACDDTPAPAPPPPRPSAASEAPEPASSAPEAAPTEVASGEAVPAPEPAPDPAPNAPAPIAPVAEKVAEPVAEPAVALGEDGRRRSLLAHYRALRCLLERGADSAELAAAFAGSGLSPEAWDRAIGELLDEVASSPNGEVAQRVRAANAAPCQEGAP